MRRVSLAVAAVLCLAAQPAVQGDVASQRAAQRADRAAPSFPLTVDSIMRGPDLVGGPPTALRWSGDSARLYFDWRRPGDKEPATYVVPRDGGEPRKLSDEEARNVPPANARWDEARRRALFVDAGDVVVIDTVAGTRRQITRTTTAESNPRWARKDTHVTFVRDGNLFIVPVEGTQDGVVEQLTDVAPKKPEPRLTDSQKFIKDEEEQLIEYIRKQREEKQRREEKEKPYKLPAFELQDRQSAIDLMLSPDDVHVFMVVAERPVGAKNTIVPNYVTDTGYTEPIPSRTVVGDTQERRLLAVLNLKTGQSVWADGSFAPPVPREDRREAGAAEKQPDEDAQPAAGEKEPETPPPGPEAQREIRWAMPVVSTDGRHVVAGARSADNKDRWYVVLDPATGSTRVVDHLTDEAWVREAGFGFGATAVGFLPDNRRIYFLSERDGWMHLYTLDVSDPQTTARQLTSGRWEITDLELAPDRKKFYITSTEVHPGERHVFTMSTEGGARTRLTSRTGGHAAQVSHDERTLGLVYSYSNVPPELFLMANQSGADARQVTTTPTEEWRRFNWIDPKLITFRARDGEEVYARLYTPEMAGARRDPSRPGVVFVHGAGYLQNAHRYWSSYYREYMFHNLLAARGYVVLDVDFRASAGYGRDWRTAIYRHMGGKDLEDIVDGAKYLVEREQVHPRRIGVYGGSYGGFITLMAMFTTPDVFAAGAALRPVTDWARYNHGYTSNILNVPFQDVEAYRRSSPIYFAEGLKGALLIAHGMVDVNVHYQDSVRLAQRLIELRKENWELASYPVEDHAFTEETSWADQYRRILKLFEEHLRRGNGRATD